MIQIRYDKLASQQFAVAFQALANAKLGIKAVYAVKKIGDALTSARKKVNDDYRALVEQYAEKDAKGMVKLADEKDEHSFVIQETQKPAWAAACKDFDAKTVQLDRPKIDVTQLDQAGLTAASLSALEDVLDFSGLEALQDAQAMLSVVK
jgi:hypothetical protein